MRLIHRVGELREAKYKRRGANNNKVRNAKCDTKANANADAKPSSTRACGNDEWLAEADLSFQFRVRRERCLSEGVEPSREEPRKRGEDDKRKAE